MFLSMFIKKKSSINKDIHKTYHSHVYFVKCYADYFKKLKSHTTKLVHYTNLSITLHVQEPTQTKGTSASDETRIHERSYITTHGNIA